MFIFGICIRVGVVILPVMVKITVRLLKNGVKDFQNQMIQILMKMMTMKAFSDVLDSVYKIVMEKIHVVKIKRTLMVFGMLSILVVM